MKALNYSQKGHDYVKLSDSIKRRDALSSPKRVTNINARYYLNSGSCAKQDGAADRLVFIRVYSRSFAA